MNIVLASNSPRRKELLSSLGYKFRVEVIPVEELLPENVDAKDAAAYLSELKAAAYNVGEGDLVITADTVVVCDDQVLGKPENREVAVAMLEMLSGRAHQVYTAFTLKTAKVLKVVSVKTNVVFDKITAEEANYYVDNFRPFDKAGSYGIQEWIGMAKIKEINGCFYSVMGLPLNALYQALKEFGL